MSEANEIDVLGKLRKYGGLFSSIAAFTNLALGTFLAFSYFSAQDHECDTSLPVWMAVSGVTSLIYGGDGEMKIWFVL